MFFKGKITLLACLICVSGMAGVQDVWAYQSTAVETAFRQWNETGAVQQRYNEQASMVGQEYRKGIDLFRKQGGPYPYQALSKFGQIESARRQEVSGLDRRNFDALNAAHRAERAEMVKKIANFEKLEQWSGKSKDRKNKSVIGKKAVPGDNGYSRGPAANSYEEQSSAQEVVVDGSGIPKELEFSGPSKKKSDENKKATLQGK